MITKKETLFLAELIEKEKMHMADQTTFSQNHKERLIKCVAKLEKCGLIRVRNNTIILDEFKGYFIGRVLVGFGVLMGDKDFNGKKAIL